MLRKACGLAVFGLIGIALVGGIAPGCNDSGDSDLAARIVGAQSAAQNTICGCAVARGVYTTKEQCIAEEFKTAPLADEACLRQVIEDFPADRSAIVCEAANLDVLASCFDAASCDTIAFAACPTGGFASASRLFRFEECDEASPEFDAAAQACQLTGAEAADILVDSRSDANAALCNCDASAPGCPNLPNYDAACAAQVAADHGNGIDLLVCQIGAFDDYLDCIDQLIPACDTGGIGVCNRTLDSARNSCNAAAGPVTSAALDACD